ncbi:MAG: hypothetical protein K6E40_14840, partial [Desulfovibrio sp.]|nr:hypothetical protein [Desulfovibrio sp.]
MCFKTIARVDWLPLENRRQEEAGEAGEAGTATSAEQVATGASWPAQTREGSPDRQVRKTAGKGTKATDGKAPGWADCDKHVRQIVKLEDMQTDKDADGG